MQSLRFLRFIEYSFLFLCFFVRIVTVRQICKFALEHLRDLERLLICRNACGNSHEPVEGCAREYRLASHHGC